MGTSSRGHNVHRGQPGLAAARTRGRRQWSPDLQPYPGLSGRLARGVSRVAWPVGPGCSGN
jgi:hypothetical protein